MKTKNRPVSRSFAEILPSLQSLAQRPASPKARTEKIKNNWKDIMQEDMTKTMHCHEVIIRRKQYILQVSASDIHPLMMRHHSPAIVKKINDFFGETVIDDVKLITLD